jgi:hypothetical protein
MSVCTTIEQTIGLKGTDGPEWHMDQRLHGPFAPLLYAAETPNGIHLVSCSLTNTEWWQTFLPRNLCPRVGGALGIADWIEPYCKQDKPESCAEACGAEDGFVELRANRFRLAADAAIIAKRFHHLNEFLLRAERLIAAQNQARTMGWQLTRQYPLPCLDVMVPPDHLVSHLQGLAAMWPSLTGVPSGLEVEHLPPFDLEALDIDSEDGLMAMAQHYALREILRNRAEFLLADLVAERGGEVAGQEYKLARGLRYVISHQVACFVGDKGGYMGAVDFTGGLAQIKQFVATTLGGGRW